MVVRHHLALAYEANGELERAREAIDQAVQDLDRIYTGENGEKRPEPKWAAEVRSMQERLSREG